MAAALTIRLDGRAALSQGLEAFVAAANERAGRSVVANAYRIDGLAKRAAPVDTGRLRASIHVEADGPLSAAVGTDVTYAPHQELGTRHMAAQPFLLPAFEAVRPGFVADLKDAVEGAAR